MKGGRILVAGGGIGGLTAALALLRHGFEVELFEAARAWTEVGAGVTLAPNAMLGFQYLGLGPAIEALGMEPRWQEIRNWEDGRVLKSLERGGQMRERYGAPYLYMHRADLHRILVDAVEAAGGHLHLASPVTEAACSEEGASLTLADGRQVQGDLVVGADGVKSAIRTLFEPKPAHFTGHIVWRALAPVDETLTEFATRPGNFIGPERLVVYYPLRGGTLLNLVFFARQKGWTEDGWTIPAERRELEEVFAGWCEAVQGIIARVDEKKLFKWAINARSPLDSWTIGDRITLLGDAAHAMTPFLGQGASSAIEDGVVLARALAASDTLAEGLRRYETARVERANFIQAESNANANRMQTRETDSFADKKLRNEETLGLFAYDCGSVPV
jgi:salicylate hydroxylase